MLLGYSKMLTGLQDANSSKSKSAGFPPVFGKVPKAPLPHTFLASSRRDGVKVLKLVVSCARARESHKAQTVRR